MEEYKIITGTGSECQKWLNQWKHEFELKIISMSVIVTDLEIKEIIILLTRTKK